MVIKTFDQMIAVLDSMQANLPTYAAGLGTTAADQTFLDQSLVNARYIDDYADTYDVNKKAVFSAKQRFYNGEPGGIAAVPVTPAYAPPFAMQGDIHGLLMKLIGRILTSAGYKEDPIGKALGIAPDPPPPPDPATLKPTVDAFAGQVGYLYTVVTGSRSGYDFWELDVQSVGGAWTTVGRFDGKSQDVIYVPIGADAGQPVQINIRVRLWKAGSPVGLFSDTVTITVNP